MYWWGDGQARGNNQYHHPDKPNITITIMKGDLFKWPPPPSWKSTGYWG